MSLEDRARRAADDLAAKAAAAKVPGPGAAHRFRAAWAFAAGALAIAVLVLLPLVFLGGPREPDDPAVTTGVPVPTTQATPPTVAAPTTPDQPPVTDPPGGTVRLVTIADLQSLVPERTGAVVSQLEWGSGPDRIGLNEKGVGSCCFDIASDGSIVILDSAKGRLLAVGPRLAGPRTIVQWAAEDFVPTAMMIAPIPRDDVIFVLGMTNRPGRPIDLITLKLDGTVIERAETIAAAAGELVRSAGSVWATTSGSTRVGWIQLATEAGDVIDVGDQMVQDSLLLSDRSLFTVESTQGTGVIVTRFDPAGISNRYEIDLGGDTWGHFAIPAGDGLLIWASTTDVALDGSVGRIVAMIDVTGNVVDGFSWQGSQWAEVGPFGLTRRGPDGAVYDLFSTEAGLSVRR
ncbi:MAG: hypothetical protein OEM97_11275, partial [Acidimicrobiia bacterium]|nr:hypothetical protein [Acidimicrobiia bacterium]